MKWIKWLCRPSPVILDREDFKDKSTEDLIKLLRSGSLSMQTGTRAATMILERFYAKLGE